MTLSRIMVEDISGFRPVPACLSFNRKGMLTGTAPSLVFPSITFLPKERNSSLFATNNTDGLPAMTVSESGNGNKPGLDCVDAKTLNRIEAELRGLSKQSHGHE